MITMVTAMGMKRRACEDGLHSFQRRDAERAEKIGAGRTRCPAVPMSGQLSFQ